MIAVGLFYLALGGVLMLAAVCLGFLIEAFGWEQPWMPRETFDEAHSHRERL